MKDLSPKLRKVLLIAVIALLIAVLAYTTPQAATGGNGTNFTLNISTQPTMNTSTTLVNGTNIVMSQDTANRTITVSSTASGVDNASILINESQVNNLTSDLNSKVNKSGDNMTGLLDVNISSGHITSIAGITLNTTRIANYTFKNNEASYLSASGIQVWQLRGIDFNGNPLYGYISYSFPGGNPGILFYNTTGSRRIETYMSANGYTVSASDTNASNTGGRVTFQTQSQGSSMQLNALIGSGNAYVCVDSTGTLYRASVCS